MIPSSADYSDAKTVYVLSAASTRAAVEMRLSSRGVAHGFRYVACRAWQVRVIGCIDRRRS